MANLQQFRTSIKPIKPVEQYNILYRGALLGMTLAPSDIIIALRGQLIDDKMKNKMMCNVMRMVEISVSSAQFYTNITVHIFLKRNFSGSRDDY